MYVVLLNWKAAENDPFTAFNATLADYLRACGKPSKIVELTSNSWVSDIVDIMQDGIDFVFSWQGIGTDCLVGEKRQNFWDNIKVPLISYHGDHPCHMPSYHALDSRYCAHIYAYPEYSLYANRHFRKQSRSISLQMPLLCSEPPFGSRKGDFFVLPKNTLSPFVLEGQWKQHYSERLFGLHMAAAETLRPLLAREPHLDVHAVLDRFLDTQGDHEIRAVKNPDEYHLFHSKLDSYARCYKAELVLDELKDIPLKIVGSGWDHYAKCSNKNHEFFSANNVVDNQFQYYSRYGIIDITPTHTGIHDRQCRAMHNETPFISSGFLPGFLPNLGEYSSLFYTFTKDDLREKCEAIISDPESHAELARDFSHQYQSRIHPSEFVWKLDSIARSIDRT